MNEESYLVESHSKSLIESMDLSEEEEVDWLRKTVMYAEGKPFREIFDDILGENSTRIVSNAVCSRAGGKNPTEIVNEIVKKSDRKVDKFQYFVLVMCVIESVGRYRFAMRGGTLQGVRIMVFRRGNDEIGNIN